ncbi:hypothetical protein [Rhodoblastus sp.]|jgi:hypothetical protein|uniref:hypothetical protein n=1 Tax=Rhodoblastus sp. TaxID=1962975 RepID=UPI0025D6BD6B|nr:hypothetical protein [Rhodoblastus sp.]
MVRLASFVAFALLLGAAAPALAKPTDDPDWPCAQRRTGEISAAAVWSGPDLASAGRWDDDAGAAALARKLASRRTQMTEMDGLIDEFAASAGADKSMRLTRVFAGALDVINSERNRVIAGVVRYARGQHRLAEKIRAEADKISDEQESKDVSSPSALDDASSSLKWDKRIFDDRSRALSYVCETPILLERRAFEIARKIQQRL